LIDHAIPFAAMHAAVICGVYAGCGGPTDADEYTCMLITYQHIAGKSDRLDMLADTCERRQRHRSDLTGDLIAAYGALARLARWRAAQLREGLICH
jgi:hypothetical protein